MCSCLSVTLCWCEFNPFKTGDGNMRQYTVSLLIQVKACSPTWEQVINWTNWCLVAKWILRNKPQSNLNEMFSTKNIFGIVAFKMKAILFRPRNDTQWYPISLGNIPGLELNGHHFEGDNVKHIFLIENVWFKFLVTSVPDSWSFDQDGKRQRHCPAGRRIVGGYESWLALSLQVSQAIYYGYQAF